MDDIVFESAYFFFEMPVLSTGSILSLEADSSWYVLRLSLPERVSVG